MQGAEYEAANVQGTLGLLAICWKLDLDRKALRQAAPRLAKSNEFRAAIDFLRLVAWYRAWPLWRLLARGLRRQMLHLVSTKQSA